ncbi:MAG TPA: hypothetical protein PKX99_05465 [Thermoanaerobaculia bacterium]|nr:hypothetical protein [Thermoanaerobaculia bacterium]
MEEVAAEFPAQDHHAAAAALDRALALDPGFAAALRNRELLRQRVRGEAAAAAPERAAAP